jgi:alkaline ceramidase TOD1/glycosyltransferase MUCI70-like protein
VKVGIYSALYGGYDWPKPLPNGVTGVLYTDDPDLEVEGWEVRLFTMDHVVADDPMMQHKWWKTHPLEALPHVDASIWLDASMQVMVPDYAQRHVRALGEDDWACVRHPSRSCIYPEAEFSATLPRYFSQTKLLAQAAHYASIGHPANWGLVATGSNIRRHTPLVEKVSDLWWDECVNWSHQDQLSLPVLFRLYPELRWNYNIPWFEWWHLHPHLK